ncbi:sensor histidine kinase [Tepidibacillus fermentans]|uniref:sensor histidine kinase n=1 Tax=Tepidibacillus fermentans TaxID=1281767 RepID=UPI001052C443|nr:sensor histidine kinase [Tepidibacillus fermentans]
MQKDFDGQSLERVLKKTIEAIENSKKQIFEITENSRADKEKLLQKLELLNIETKKVIDEVDHLEEKYRRARMNLAHVSRNFKKFTEEDIQRAYEEANELQVRLYITREREGNLKARRNELQLSLRNIEFMIERAEVLMTQIGVVFDYLSGDLFKVSEVIESAQYRQLYGLKIIQAQEEERKRVAREIHDGPAQSMANVVLRTEIAERFLHHQQMDQAMQELRDLKDMVRQSLADVRKIIFDLRPMALDDLGLFPTLRKYTQELAARENFNLELKLTGRERRLPSMMEVAIFRLIQEALNNVVKHANASNVSVHVDLQDNLIKVMVKDDGVGFSEDRLNRERDHFGLMGMKERVQLLEGKMDIQSEKNKGTTVTFVIQIKEGEEKTNELKK